MILIPIIFSIFIATQVFNEPKTVNAPVSSQELRETGTISRGK